MSLEHCLCTQVCTTSHLIRQRDFSLGSRERVGAIPYHRQIFKIHLPCPCVCLCSCLYIHMWEEIIYSNWFNFQRLTDRSCGPYKDFFSRVLFPFYIQNLLSPYPLIGNHRGLYRPLRWAFVELSKNQGTGKFQRSLDCVWVTSQKFPLPPTNQKNMQRSHFRLINFCSWETS